MSRPRDGSAGRGSRRAAARGWINLLPRDGRSARVGNGGLFRGFRSPVSAPLARAGRRAHSGRVSVPTGLR